MTCRPFPSGKTTSARIVGISYIEPLRNLARRDHVTPKQDDSGSSRSSRWLKSNLVTLGSAAVLAVYSAGFARTRTAAAEFSDEPRGRRAPERPTHEVAAPAPAPQADTHATAPATADSATRTPAPAAKREAVAKTPAVAAKVESTPQPVVNADTAPKQIAGLSGGVLNVCGNLSSITTPIAIGYIIQSTGSFNGALVYVAANALVAILSYLVLVGEIKRVELTTPSAA